MRGSNSGFSWDAPTDTGGSGIAKYHFYVDGVRCGDSLVAGFTPPAGACKLTEGTHAWAVSAEDATGNIRWCNEAPGGVVGPDGSNIPAPFAAYTRAGCDVGRDDGVR